MKTFLVTMLLLLIPAQSMASPDKAYHLITSATLAFVGTEIMKDQGVDEDTAALSAFLLVMALGLAKEMTDMHASPEDVFFNSIGASLGIVAASYTVRF